MGGRRSSEGPYTKRDEKEPQVEYGKWLISGPNAIWPGMSTHLIESIPIVMYQAASTSRE